MTAKIHSSAEQKQTPIPLEVLNSIVADAAAKVKAAPAPAPAPPSAPGASFPIDCFPARAQELVKAAEIAQGAPPDYMAACMLWTAGTATGNACKLEVKPGTIETAIFFLGIVGNPNAVKSPTIRFALRPLHDANKAAFDQYNRDKAEFDTIQGMGKDERRQQGITGVPTKPILSKVLMNDTTPEALATAHFNRLRGLGVNRDELSAWIKAFDRYNSGGEMDTWLSIWSAEHLSIDRKTADPIYISRPFIGVIGGIQPGRLESLAADDRAVSGFIDRLLFVWPDNLDKPDWSMRGMDMGLVGAWQTAANKLLELPFDDSAEKTISMTDSARQRLFAWFNTKNKARCNDAQNELLQGMYGKFDIHCTRIVLALHLLRFAYSDQAAPGEVDEATVTDGIRIAEYFISQSEKVHGRIFAASAVDRLPRNEAALYEALPQEFKTGDGVKIAEKFGVPERTFKRFLKKRELFTSICRGTWEKSL